MKVQLYGHVNSNFRLHTKAINGMIESKIKTINPTTPWNEKLGTKTIEEEVLTVKIFTPVIPENKDTSLESIRDNFKEHVNSINTMLKHLKFNEDQYVQFDEFLAMALYQTLGAFPSIEKKTTAKNPSIFH